MQQLAREALKLQQARALKPFLHSWADMLSRIEELATPADARAFHKHPINLVLAQKLFELLRDGSDVELSRAFHAVKQLVEQQT
jgi:hypothetical protein